MARKLKKLPKWAIKKAGGINKKAWALARRGRGPARSRSKTSKKSRKAPRRVGGGSTARKGPGMMAKLNGFLRGIKVGLPAVGSFTAGLPVGDAVMDAATRYSGYNLKDNTFDTGKATVTAGFVVGNVVEQKVLSALKIPQMAGQKKLLALGGQYLPEIQAVGELAQGAPPKRTVAIYGVRSIGYNLNEHSSLESAVNRDSFVQTMTARVALGLASKFIGPMVNKHLPKGVNL